MNKKILAVIIIIIVAIVAAVAFIGGNSADEVLEYSDYSVTCPADCYSEEDGDTVQIIPNDYDKPAVTIIKTNMTGTEFDQLVAAQGLFSDEQLLSLFNKGASSTDGGDNVKIDNFNVTKFGNYSSVDFSVSEGSDKYTYHIIKVSDSKIYWVIEDTASNESSKIANSIKFTA